MKVLRIYITILLYVLVSVVLTSCTQEESFPSKNEPVVSLQLQLGKSSRATIAGVDDLNENKVSTIDVFLFKADADDNQAAIYHGSVSESGITYDGVTQTASFNLNISAGKYNTLFPRNDVNTCKAYFILNRPQGSVLPELANCSLTALKKLVIQSSQFQTVVTTSAGKRILTKQPLFVMDGFADDITRDVNTMQLSRTQPVPVARAAVKIQLLLESISDNVTDGGKTWNADKENVRVMLRNGVNRGYLNEAMQASYLINTNDKDLVNDIFHLENISLDEKDADGGNLTTSYPMYMYPTYWGDNDAIRPVLILTIDWVNADDDTEKKTTYYEIPVNAASDYLVRNSFYQIRQKVTIVGSEDIEDPVRLYPSTYVILAWGNAKDAEEDTDTDAEVNMPRYLVVEEKEVVMQNTNQKDLKYFTSHPIKIQNLKVQRMDTSGNTAGLQDLFEQNDLTEKYDEDTKTYTVDYSFKINGQDQNKRLAFKINDEDGYISLIHDLKNDMNATSDYTEYVFTFDVVHSDQPAYKESVNVEQYPMIAIKADLNSVYKDDSNSNNDNSNNGYVRINNKNDGTNSNWDAVRGLEGSNKNPNRYIIAATSLTTASSNDYMIGDPRSKENDVPTGLSKDSSNENLEYYYPTNRDNETITMISPEFMVASSYGVCSDAMDYEDAEKRCAAYQEDGYPAGRWRVPTRAEVKYIIQLSGWGIIPVLFNNGSYYWSAHGVVENNNGTFSDVNTDKAYVRCVYDTWYWGTGQLVDKDKFVYGDKQR